ncbi:MAG: 2-oxoacid:ferredoxin oxidoreductase subunit beta [Bacteroidetes bacterium]|nr:2-oxoacid:ferredoxin oxidoreductase subunit beta [Bacteroidota bacterium]
MSEVLNKIESIKLTAKDFTSDQDVRWCPGCGDYAILAVVQRTLPEFGIPRENFVFVSGIGCSSRFPYYMNTYGMHTIHGRATAFASGVKGANPDLSVWIITGDGDALSIGGNHFIHIIRRNFDVNIILFNNEIYGLTKGQYSPTSEVGKVTKSSPYGSIDTPFKPTSVALGAEAGFVAIGIDRDTKHLQEMIRRAHKHKGTSFLEVYQNCVIFNDGTFSALTEKDTKQDSVLYLEHGKPLVYGKENDKGIIMDGLTPKIVNLADGTYSINDLAVHDEHAKDPTWAHILSRMNRSSDYPQPLGVFRDVERPTYEKGLVNQIELAKGKRGKGNLESLFNEGDVWENN